MSQENVEVLRRMIDAFNRGDRDEALAYYAAEVEYQTSGQFADEGVYRGPAGVQRLWAQLREDMEELNLSVSDIRAVGDRIFAAGMMRGRGKQSKAGFEQPFWYAVTFRDGLIVRVEAYVDRTQALEAAGCGSRALTLVPPHGLLLAARPDFFPWSLVGGQHSRRSGLIPWRHHCSVPVP
jgi:ketosteroid isomerase-like protein